MSDRSASERNHAREETDREFERLYRNHRIDVYRAAMRRTHDHHEAEDVTQSAFLDAYRAVLRGSEPELPRAWLLAIAENVRRRRFASTLRRPDTAPLDEEALETRSRSSDDTEGILTALAALPANQRSAFVLREVGGLSYGEIASRLDVSVAAVQMLLFRARQGLRAKLAPALGKVSGLLVPHWLAGLVSRFESASAGARSLSVGARSLGAVGAAVVAAGGVVAASADSQPPATVRGTPPAVVTPAERAAVPALAAVSARAAVVSPPAKAAGRAQPRPTRWTTVRVRTSPVASAPVASATPVVPVAVVPAPAAAEPHAVPVDASAAPAAPSSEAAASESGVGGRPTPALVPLSPTFGTAVLPDPTLGPPLAPVPEVEPPSVEVPEAPGVPTSALDLPAVPSLPVEVGDVLLLPGS